MIKKQEKSKHIQKDIEILSQSRQILAALVGRYDIKEELLPPYQKAAGLLSYTLPSGDLGIIDADEVILKEVTCLETLLGDGKRVENFSVLQQINGLIKLIQERDIYTKNQ